MLFLLFVFFFHLGTPVIVQKVEVPQPTVAGHIARLECQWSAGSGPPLYSLRWCKDGEQFYVVTVRPRIHQAVFPTPGVHVLLSMSNERVLSLTNVTAETSGTYTCEAMSDEPDFLSSARSERLSVIELPVSGPTWSGVLSVYHVHQNLRARCHVHGSRPPARFTFLINDIKILHEEPWVTTDTPRVDTSSQTWNSSSWIFIPLTPGNILRFFPRRAFYSPVSRAGEYLFDHPSYQSPRIFVASATQDNFVGNNDRPRVTEESFYMAESSSRSSGLSPATHAVSFPRSASQTRKINLTCLADVGGLVHKTTAVSLVSFPTEIHYTSITKGAISSGSVHGDGVTWIFLLIILYVV